MYILTLVFVFVTFSGWLGGRMLADSIAKTIRGNLYRNEEAKARLMKHYERALLTSYISFGLFCATLLANYVFM